MGFCSFLGRSALFLLNLAFLAAGIVLLAVGIVYKVNEDVITDALSEAAGILSLVPILLIVIGCVVTVVSFFGCCGAATRSICLLKSYIILIIIIIILQVALGVYAFIQFNDDQSKFKKYLSDLVSNVFGDYSNNQAVIDGLQRELECCGVNGPAYWGDTIPSSCCTETAATCTTSNAFSTGCADKVWSQLRSSTIVIGVVATVLAAFEVILTIFAGCQISAAERKLNV